MTSEAEFAEDQRDALAEVYSVLREAAARRRIIEDESTRMAHIWMEGIQL